MGIGLQAGMLRPVIGASDPYSAAVLADSPVAYWRLGEASGSTAADETSTHNGTYAGTPIYSQTGAVAGNDAVGFNDINDIVTVSSNAAFETSTFSVEAWAKRSGSTANGRIVNMRAAGANTGIILAHNASGTRVRVTVGTGSALVTVTDASDTTDGVWTHFVATYDGTDLRLYRNGSLVAGPTTTTYSVATGQNVTIGLDVAGVGTRFNGDLDEVAFYDTALSAARIAAHYAAA